MLFSAGTKYFGIFAAVKQFFKIIEHFFFMSYTCFGIIHNYQNFEVQ